MKARNLILTIGILTLGVAGCGGGGSSSGGGGSKTVSSIALSPANPNISIGGTQQFTATARDSSGHSISGVSFVWKSSDTSSRPLTTRGLPQEKLPEQPA